MAIEIANAPSVAKTARSNKPAAMAPARLAKPTARRSGMWSIGDMTNDQDSPPRHRNKAPESYATPEGLSDPTTQIEIAVRLKDD